MNQLDQITGEIIDSAFKIHKTIGPGLLESVYEMILFQELTNRKLQVTNQKYISFEYEGIVFKNAFKVDLLVESSVVIEVKSVEKTLPVHSKQVLTYLKLMNLPVGLLLNFGTALMKDGISRIVNHYEP
ncbi:GxxExxY protein [Leptospira licerasiae]|uniref:GxxExxY protein n=1 Tax=Leptospira licerasiae str. MMD4847 TaxID=1049971 RepID=A0ABN0H523_9LEPT|nr:GxxExxY protein [Leptospira licerasiae]EIE00570.1 GxxExxY protein [Leptospira licerasiae serovar Varillal str. VAR 010]EJZ40822.1 GxxExxY protein [Leptospira licerasiae str. MMD4847]